MLLLMQIGDPEKGQFILVDTSEATEENENTTHVSIKGIFTSPFFPLLGVLTHASTYNYTFETAFTEGMRSNYVAHVSNSDSWLELPKSSVYHGASVRVYVDKNSTCGLKIKPEYLLNKKSFTIEVGQMVELMCINRESEFLGWYIIESIQD